MVIKQRNNIESVRKDAVKDKQKVHTRNYWRHILTRGMDENNTKECPREQNNSLLIN